VVRLSMSRRSVSPAKAAEPIVVSFRISTRVGPRNYVLDGGGPDSHVQGAILRVKGAGIIGGIGHARVDRILKATQHWHHLSNTIESSVCSGDAALWQITLSTGYY